VPLVCVWLHIATGKDAVVRLSHMTGEVVSVQVYGGKMRTGSLLANSKFVDRKTGVEYPTLYFVDEKYSIHSFPEGDTVASLPEDAKVYFHEVDTATGEVRGYSVSTAGAVPAWSIRLQSEAGEKIVATSIGQQSPASYITKDNIRTLVNKTSNKNELHTKYINPNAIFIVTHVAENATSPNTPHRRQGGYLVLYLVDGVTGAILSSMVQTNAQPPVQVTAVENMFVYHFVNTKRVRYQLGVWELFDDLDRYRGLTAESTTPLSYVAKSLTGRGSHVTSAFVQPPPQVNALAFTFPSALKGLTSTVSLGGIQTKHLVAALSSDEIVAIDLLKHIQAGVSTMSWMPTQTLTHNRTVLGVTDVRSFPTKLESTSLLAAFGTDLFFSRVCPTKAFDMIGDDFGYSMLILTVCGVCLICFVVYYFNQRKKLNQSWQ